MVSKQDYKQWHVVYTRSRAEKKVYQELEKQGIESFLPLQKRLRQWKDRKKWIDVPLISGYCFVNISRKEYDEVLHNNNVVCYITFEGRAAVVPPRQIDSLKRITEKYDFDIDVSQKNFEKGKQVEIVKGPLVGVRGELVDFRGKHKFILRIKEIDTSFIVEVPANCLSVLCN